MDASTLLALPKELRLQIWDAAFAAVLADQDGCVVVGRPRKRPWECRPEPYHPALLQVCSTIRREALPLLYRGRPVVLLLRYRESRSHTEQWISELAQHPTLHKHVRTVSVRYFETAHRATSMLIDCDKWIVANRHEWIHPLTREPLNLLVALEDTLDYIRSATPVDATINHFRDGISTVVNLMTSPLEDFMLLGRESMASARLHEHSHLRLRFEFIRVLYSSPRRALH